MLIQRKVVATRSVLAGMMLSIAPSKTQRFFLLLFSFLSREVRTRCVGANVWAYRSVPGNHLEKDEHVYWPDTSLTYRRPLPRCQIDVLGCASMQTVPNQSGILFASLTIPNSARAFFQTPNKELEDAWLASKFQAAVFVSLRSDAMFFNYCFDVHPTLKLTRTSQCEST